MRNGVPKSLRFSWDCLLELVDCVLAVYLFTYQTWRGIISLDIFFFGPFSFEFFWKQDPIASWSDEHQKSQEFVDLA